MAEHRLTGLRADLDVYVTFEGDNNVMLQLVAKRLLGDYAKAFKSPDFGTLAQYVAGQFGEATINRGGLRGLAQNIVDFGSNRAVGWLRERRGAPAPAPHRSRSHHGREHRKQAKGGRQ
jgi:acyl-CoA oxidase